MYRSVLSLTVFITATLIGSAASAASFCTLRQWATNHKAYGKGTEAKPYRLCSTMQLQSLSAASADWGKWYTLERDLDLSPLAPANFSPIGNASVPFSGHFLGLASTLSNFNYQAPLVSMATLFGRVTGAVRDLRVVNVNVYASGNVGGLVGVLDGGTLSDIHVDGGLVRSNTSFTGGLVGNAIAATILRSSVVGVTVDGNLSMTGGLAGAISGGTTVADCFASGTAGSTAANVGGLIGGATDSFIYDSFATGAVNAFNSPVGGLVGSCNGSVIDNAFAAATVSGNDPATTNERVGLFVGQKSCASVTNSFYDRKTCTNTGGDHQCTSDMAGVTGIFGMFFPAYFRSPTTEPLASWDFVDTWLEVPSAYPDLQSAQ